MSIKPITDTLRILATTARIAGLLDRLATA